MINKTAGISNQQDTLFTTDNDCRGAVVLVVDDDATMRFLIREVLQQADFQVIEAENGQQALDLFEQVIPDIVLMDVSMPEKDGYATCLEIRQMPHGRYLPILMATGFDDMVSVNRAYSAGATDFLIKPINWTVLGHRVRYMLRSARNLDQLRESQKNNQALIDGLPDTIVRISASGVVLDCKFGDDSSLRIDKEGIIGHKIDTLLQPGLGKEVNGLLVQVFKTSEPVTKEFTLKLEDKKYVYEGRFVKISKHEIVCILRDITGRRKVEEEIRFLAYNDSLTMLPNRSFFNEWVNNRLDYLSSSTGYLSVFILDLDNFKQINDTLGHHIGDSLLKNVAIRLQQAIDIICDLDKDYSDDCEFLLSRFGSDEFAVVFSSNKNVIPVDSIAKQLKNEFGHAVILQGHEVFITVSIGVASYPTDGNELHTLIKNADTALHHSKRNGQNHYSLYSSRMNARSLERLTLENSLRKALSANEFFLCYQPQVNLNTGKIIGAEALIRWHHPEKGIISPEGFIPMAESTGLINSIGEWVLLEACTQMKKWLDQGFSLKRMAINLSSVQFQQADFMKIIREVIASTGLLSSYVELELTETSVMRNAEKSISLLHDIREEGMALSVDDFGTGYSSLSYLKRFPINALKIDRSFIQDLQSNPDDAAITFSIIAMAHNLNLKVIAEGVENEEQLKLLQLHHCDEGQGFLFGHPLVAEEFIKLLAKQAGAE
jgi:diguanylate cyclase (GGDEF)-like protein